MSAAPFVSVILPCYNEKGNILPLARAVHENLAAFAHEVIVVDDNSPDGTYDIVMNSGLDYVRAIKRPSDPSLGKSIRTGLEAAKGDAIVFMDSDFNHKPEYLERMIVNLKYYDCVSGSRFVYGGGMDTKFRHIASWVFNITARILTRTMVTDSLFGFIAMRRDVIEKIDYDRVFWGYGDYCIRLMYYLQMNGASILQIPTMLGTRPTGQSKSNLVRMLLKYSREVAALALKKKNV